MDWALVILKWCFAVYLKFRFDWAGWDGAALQARAFEANPGSSDTQRCAESSRADARIWSVGRRLGAGGVQDSFFFNLEKSQLHILLQLSLPGGTPEATRYPKAFSAASSVYM